MKTIIAGNRNYTNKRFIDNQIREYMKHTPISEILEGGATGVDELAGLFAITNNIPRKTFYAPWAKYGKQAGPIRNEDMVRQADALLAFWDGRSRGTADIIRRAKRKGIKVTIITI